MDQAASRGNSADYNHGPVGVTRMRRLGEIVTSGGQFVMLLTTSD